MQGIIAKPLSMTEVDAKVKQHIPSNEDNVANNLDSQFPCDNASEADPSDLSNLGEDFYMVSNI